MSACPVVVGGKVAGQGRRADCPVPRILICVARSDSPPANADRSIRLEAVLLPVAAILLGAAGPSWRLPRLAVRGLAGATAVLGPMLALLGAHRHEPPRTASQVDDRRPPLITILVPARNEAQVIGALLSDLGRLRGRPPEVIVIDDASDDGTGDVASAKIAAAGVNGRVVRRSRSGDGKGRALAHVAIEPDDGRVIVILDADARVDPGFAEACAAAATGDVAATARRRILRPVGGSRAAEILARLQDDEQSLDDVVQRARVAFGGAAEFRGNGMVLRADVLATLGGWPVDAVCEDLELSSRLYQATGRGVTRPPGFIVWEQPVIGLRALFRQRLRWAEGSIRRDLRIVYPAALRGATIDGRSLEPLGYAGQALVPWVIVGLAWRCRGSRRAAARRGLAALLGAYAIAATSIGWAAIGASPGESLSRRAARTVGSTAFALLWLAILPLAWLRIVRRPGTTEFAKSIHAPAAAFSEPEPAPPEPTWQPSATTPRGGAGGGRASPPAGPTSARRRDSAAPRSVRTCS